MKNSKHLHEISKNYLIISYPTLENCLCRAVRETKSVNDIDNYRYSRCGIGFDTKGKFLVGNGFGRNYIIFEVDMNSSVHVDNEKKDIIILLTQGFSFCLSLHYNGANIMKIIWRYNRHSQVFNEKE